VAEGEEESGAKKLRCAIQGMQAPSRERQRDFTWDDREDTMPVVTAKAKG
jgi:hypothetical protein